MFEPTDPLTTIVIVFIGSVLLFNDHFPVNHLRQNLCNLYSGKSVFNGQSITYLILVLNFLINPDIWV